MQQTGSDCKGDRRCHPCLSSVCLSGAILESLWKEPNFYCRHAKREARKARGDLQELAESAKQHRHRGNEAFQ